MTLIPPEGMSNSQFDRIWKLLNEYEFKLDNREFHCAICLSTLKNARQSPCGCRYCLECVTNYLESETRCPNDTEECRTQQLYLDSNLQVDYIINKRIATQVVQCPLPDCEFTSELRRISRHLDNSHSDKNCPFMEMGCQSTITGLSSVSRHLQSDGGNLEHARLLTTTVSELQSEVCRLSDSLLNFKKTSGEKLERIAELENRLDDIVAVQKEEVRILREQADRQEKENQMLRTKLMELFAQEAVAQQNEKDASNCMPDDDDDRESIDAPSEMSCISYSSSRGPVNYAPFRWTVTEFMEKLSHAQNKQNSCLTSESFYSHRAGYKMCITVHPYGTGVGKSTHVSVFLHLKQGPHDSKLDWPMKLETRLCLVDQHYGNIYSDYRFSYKTVKPEERSKFDRPTKYNRNLGFGEPRLIPLSSLFNNSRIYHNDSIILRCFVGGHH